MQKRYAEWPTIILFAVVYIGWLALTYFHAYIHTALLLIPLLLLTTLHSSLQHEVIHGHPSTSNHLNLALALPALGWVIPFERFEMLHLQHHRNELLTDPYDDSESFFLAHAQWQQCSPASRQILIFHNTLVGRLLIGPAVVIIRLVQTELPALIKHPDVVRAWMLHVLGVLLVITWLVWVQFPLWLYFVGVVYPTLSLLLLRSFTEHLPEHDISHRSAIVKSNAFMQLLYLNNNFHRVHHDYPELPWYQLPEQFRRSYALETVHVYSGYLELFKRYAFTPRFPVDHPFLHRT